MKNTIYSHFRKWVERQPDALCIIDNNHRYTYSEVDSLSTSVAERLADMEGHRIGIVMNHGVYQIAAMLGVLRSGNTYVPAEPALPQERIDYMMHSASVTAIIDDSWTKNLRAGDGPVPADRSTPRSLAYILFTSGTSGKPKGVMVENCSVVNYAEAFHEEMENTRSDVMLQLSVCSFDIFVEEVFATLLNGGILAIPPAAATADIKELMSFCSRTGVTMISGFPYLLAEMNKLDKIPSALRVLISGGDVLRASYIDRLRDSGVKIFNTYGPSETTVCATYSRVDNKSALPDGTFPIGHPIKGVDVAILAEDLSPVADGEPGELCITGAGVGQGYIGNPPESRNFIRMPDGRRMYRSGDLGYRLPDGEFGFLHRLDDQVMILGKRVEPAEVENVLNTAPSVERGVVRSFKDAGGLAYLVAYFVPSGTGISLKKIKKWLGDRLADYMIPEIFVAMKSIPVNKRGKVDNTSLPRILKDE